MNKCMKREWVRKQSARDKDTTSSIVSGHTFLSWCFVFGCVCVYVEGRVCDGSVGHSDISISWKLKGSEGGCEEKVNSSHTNHPPPFKPNDPDQGCFPLSVLWISFILQIQKKQMK